MQTSLHEKEIRSLTARATQVKDPEVAREAAFKAWRTMRKNNRAKAAKGSATLLDFEGLMLNLPPGVVSGEYILQPPLIKGSKLTTVANGGVGKELSDGWVINYAIGCTFGCKFCYVDSIHKKFSFRRAGSLVYNDWGQYFSMPKNMEEVIEKTDWGKWKGKEAMMSSTHDPYLPQLYKTARNILEHALPAGVKLCIQTRSPLVERDFDLIAEYKDQVRLQVSIATFNDKLSRLAEPRVVPPRRRIQILEKANDYGLRTGIIIAPVFPPVSIRKDVSGDLEEIIEELEGIMPDNIYGESLHVRGINVAYVENALGEKVLMDGFEKKAERMFHSLLKQHGLKGRWWIEH